MSNPSGPARAAPAPPIQPTAERTGDLPTDNFDATAVPTMPRPTAEETDNFDATAVPTLPRPTVEEIDNPAATLDPGWLVIVWDDPINLMSYVTFVFRKLFGYTKEKAHRLMMQVHTEGRAVVSSGPKEKAEMDVFRLHEHGLWATMEPDR